jgi:hypothetical protein
MRNTCYKIAWAFAGLAIPPLTYKGMLVNMKAHCSCLSHAAANSLKSNNSPIGIPHPARKAS